MRVGYPCICLGRENARCQYTTILKNASPLRLRELIQANLQGLRSILQYNQEHGLRLFRLGNAFIPFASHAVNQIPWWEEFGEELASIGQWALARGHRLSFHASHFTILNSENEGVVRSALADVEYMGRVLETMGLPPEHRIILHLGVTSPTPEAALDRLRHALDQVPAPYRRHLALENDERAYTAEQAIQFSRRTGIPVVVDTLHHACNPGDWAEMSHAELLERVFETWGPEDGTPKIHFSTQDPGKRTGAHDYWIDGEQLARFLQDTQSVRREFDIMFECKGKDEAVRAILPVLQQDERFEPRQVAA